MGEHTEIILKRRAPTLWVIIVIKLLKGALFISVAIALYALSDNDLPAELRHWLQLLRFNPERRFWADLGKQFADVREGQVLWAAGGTLVYSLFSVVEGIGLIFRVSWAGWMAIGESAFFIPIEVYELLHHREAGHPGHPVMLLTILALNLFIVIYLWRNKDRLFRHHHH